MTITYSVTSVKSKSRGTGRFATGSMARIDRVPCLFVLPFLVELGDGGADGEVPGVDREILEFVGDDVAVDCFLHRDTSLVHFFGLGGDIVENFANGGNTFLAADLTVAGDENGVFVVGGEFLEGVAPTGNVGLLVDGDRIPAAEQQVSGVDDVLLRDAHDDVGAG